MIINSVLFSIINKEKINNEIILLNENKVYFINNDTYRIIIPLNNRNKKKYIKIMSSIKQFSWAYEFSQVNNTNYLGRPHSSKETLVNNNFTYIYNPLIFNGQKTNYFWFIIITYKNYDNLTISYIYNNKRGEEEESIDVKDINKNINKLTLFISIIISIIIIFIIILILVHFYKKHIKWKKNKKTKKLIDYKQKEMNNIDIF